MFFYLSSPELSTHNLDDALFETAVCLGWSATRCPPVVCHSQLIPLYVTISGIWYLRTWLWWAASPRCWKHTKHYHFSLGGGRKKSRFQKNSPVYEKLKKEKRKRLGNPHKTKCLDSHQPLHRTREKSMRTCVVKMEQDMAKHLAGAIVGTPCGQAWSSWSLCRHNPRCHHGLLAPRVELWPIRNLLLGPFLCWGLQSRWSSAPWGRTLGPECLLKWSFVGMWPGILFLQQSYSLLEHSHLGLMSLHHSHHLGFQLLQLVLMFLLCFFIGSHQVTVWEQRKVSKDSSWGVRDALSFVALVSAARLSSRNPKSTD